MATTTPIERKKEEIVDALERRLSVSSAQINDGPYAKLCPAALEGPLRPLFQFRPAKVSSLAGNTALTDLLVANSNFEGDLRGAIENRAQDNVVLLDNRVIQGGANERARERVRLSRSKRSTKKLSLRQHRILGSFGAPENLEKYKVYDKLRQFWTGYAESLISNCSERTLQARLLVADLHGAIVAVLDCKNSNLIGLQGLMVRETENTFGFITPAFKFQVVPKEGSIFRFNVKNHVVTLFGSNLDARGAAHSSNTK